MGLMPSWHLLCIDRWERDVDLLALPTHGGAEREGGTAQGRDMSAGEDVVDALPYRWIPVFHLDLAIGGEQRRGELPDGKRDVAIGPPVAVKGDQHLARLHSGEHGQNLRPQAHTGDGDGKRATEDGGDIGFELPFGDAYHAA